jgi:hypothetical protein
MTSPGRRGRGKSARSLDLIDAAAAILEEIQPASVRAVCYQLFTRGVIASMKKSETNRVSAQLTWAREAGEIPWGWIVDETREAERVSAWEHPEAFVETVCRAYRRDRWLGQPHWIEIWSEKGTIRGTLAPVLHEYGVTFRVMHGYTSATVAYQIAQETQDRGRELWAYYLGDWDPSGMHMSEVDLPQRLNNYDGRVIVSRLALLEEDITADDLPSFEADTKKDDKRYGWFRRQYGERCWELDALSPVVLRARVAEAIRDDLDLDAWRRAEIVERAERESLTAILGTWPTISRQATE